MARFSIFSVIFGFAVCAANVAEKEAEKHPFESTSVILTASGEPHLALPHVWPERQTMLEMDLFPDRITEEEIRDPYAPASVNAERATDSPMANPPMGGSHQVEVPRRHRHGGHHTTRGRFPVESDDDGGGDDSKGDEDPTTQSTPPARPTKAVYNQEEVRQAVNGSTPAGWIQMGNPRKQLYVIMDTGSDKLVAKTWDTIRRMLRMVDGGIDASVSPSSTVYDHTQSTTYTRQLMDRKAPDGSATGTKMQKRGYIAYGSGVAITDEGNDDVHVGGQTLPQFPLSEILADSLSMLHTKQGIAGILGLQHMKNNTLGESVFTRARQGGGMTSFGYCRGNNNDGTFIWGDKSTEGTEVPVVGNIHWALKLGKVRMIGKSTSASTTTTAAPERDSESEDGGGSDESSSSSDAGSADMEPMRKSRGTHRITDRGQKHGHVHALTASSMSNLATVSGKQEPDEGDDSSQSSGIDPELKEEIGKMVGDVIEKVIDKVQKAKAGGSSTQMSTQMCTDGKCAAIIDTGSNIIAGPSEALREMAKYANVKYDCSNLDKLPHIHLQLGEFKVELPPKAYVMQVTLPKWAQQGKGAGGDGSEGGGDGGGSGDGSGGSDSDEMSSRSRKMEQRPYGRMMNTKLDQESAWHSVLRELHRTHGVDLSAALPGINLAKLAGNDKLCMPAFAPLDKDTAVGKLWVIGTPIFEQYYTRWSFPKDADMPSVFFEDKTTATACKKGPDSQASSSSASSASSSDSSSGSSSSEAGSGDDSDDFTARQVHGHQQKSLSAAQVLNSVKSAVALAQHSGPGLLRRELKGDAMQLLDEGSLDAEMGVAESSTEGKLEGTSFMPRRLDAFDIRYPAWAKELTNV